jgi:hypothetical protein
MLGHQPPFLVIFIFILFLCLQTRIGDTRGPQALYLKL